MHDSTGGGEEVWRPGGTLDQDPAENTIEDGWGSAANNESNPIGSSEDSGWGSSSGAATWAPSNLDSGPSTASTSVTVQSSIKEEGATAGQIKRENIEAGAMGSEVEETPVWFMERVCVKMKNGESTGVIKDISGKTATIELEGGSSNNVSVGDIAMIEPKEHDIVLVTGGADVGVEGELVCIDGNDAILKDANEDFKIVDFVHLAKIASEA
jgi:transcription elongation factor SPT5